MEASEESTCDSGALEWERDDDADEIRYSLTALGEAVLAEEGRRTRGPRFRGFGPCVAVA
jgi:hypothetical protein